MRPAGVLLCVSCFYPLRLVQVDLGVEKLVVVTVLVLPLLDDGTELCGVADEP